MPCSPLPSTLAARADRFHPAHTAGRSRPTARAARGNCDRRLCAAVVSVQRSDQGAPNDASGTAQLVQTPGMALAYRHYRCQRSAFSAMQTFRLLDLRSGTPHPGYGCAERDCVIRRAPPTPFSRREDASAPYNDGYADRWRSHPLSPSRHRDLKRTQHAAATEGMLVGDRPGTRSTASARKLVTRNYR